MGGDRFFTLANTRDEIDRYFPWLVPIARNLGMKLMLAICYYPTPRRDDTYYTNLTKRIMEWKPDYIQLKDAGGLLTVERIKTLLPAIQKEARGVPIELHTHGMSTNQGRVVVEAMALGRRDRAHLRPATGVRIVACVDFQRDAQCQGAGDRSQHRQ